VGEPLDECDVMVTDAPVWMGRPLVCMDQSLLFQSPYCHLLGVHPSHCLGHFSHSLHLCCYHPPDPSQYSLLAYVSLVCCQKSHQTPDGTSLPHYILWYWPVCPSTGYSGQCMTQPGTGERDIQPEKP